MSENAAWGPGLDARRRLLDGRSAWELADQLAWAVRVGLLLLVLLVTVMFLPGDGGAKALLLFSVFSLLLLEGLVWIPVAVGRMLLRRRREVRCGYTTMANDFPEVDQIDPKTGQIVRLAGEGLLDRNEYLERMRLIKEVSTRGTNG